MAEDRELSDITLDGPHVLMNKVNEGKTTRLTPKTQREYNEANRKKIKMNYKAKNYLFVVQDMMNTIRSRDVIAKEIWKRL